MAIVADDLTGALDTSAPFVAAGRSVVVATRPGGLAAAQAGTDDIVVVNTASRALSSAEAARVVADAARSLLAARPQLVFKKIDSRLKGNIGVETAAVAEAFGLVAVCVAPAVPEQGRITRAGAVMGRGVDVPLPVSPLFAGLDVHVADAESSADLDRLVATTNWSATLAVGASGLGAAFARRQPTGRHPAFAPARRTLFAIGSRDAITAQQIAALDDAAIHDAPEGTFAGDVVLPAVLRCTGLDGDAAMVARRFAASVTAVVATSAPSVLVVSGGDTALAVLDALGVGLVRPRGEAARGLPWFSIARPDGSDLRVVVKSGGFGDRRSLATLLPAQPA